MFVRKLYICKLLSRCDTSEEISTAGRGGTKSDSLLSTLRGYSTWRDGTQRRDQIAMEEFIDCYD